VYGTLRATVVLEAVDWTTRSIVLNNGSCQTPANTINACGQCNDYREYQSKEADSPSSLNLYVYVPLTTTASHLEWGR
jgi:hypothetical protein